MLFRSQRTAAQSFGAIAGEQRDGAAEYEVEAVVDPGAFDGLDIRVLRHYEEPRVVAPWCVADGAELAHGSILREEAVAARTLDHFVLKVADVGGKLCCLGLREGEDMKREPPRLTRADTGEPFELADEVVEGAHRWCLKNTHLNTYLNTYFSTRACGRYTWKLQATGDVIVH